LDRNFEEWLFRPEVLLLKRAAYKRALRKLVASELANQLALAQAPLLAKVRARAAVGLKPHLPRIVEPGQVPAFG
jgi:hypothetical protein